MINNNLDTLPLFDFKNGDQVTAAAINNNAIEVYNKFNFLNPNNIGTINTGMFYDQTNGIFYTNFCGYHHTSFSRKWEMDDLIDVLVDEINDVINLNTGG